MTADVIQGDCLDVMAALAPDSVDAIVTDPPYALTANKRGGSGPASLNLNSPAGRARIGTGGGFMGKEWDSALPGVDVWAAALRVVKPGAYMLAFGGTRTYHRLTCAIEDAGWEIQDCLSWLYGSGFPKHQSKLKPAWEPIVLARKPAKRATLLNIDACRIGDEVRVEACNSLAPCHGNRLGAAGTQGARRGTQGAPKQYVGRWPANVLLDEEAAAALDEQSGERPTSGNVNATRQTIGYAGAAERLAVPINYHDTGGASRFYYCAKASRSERNAGLHNPGAARKRNEHVSGINGADLRPAGSNVHPTVKPIALMRWLCRLIAPAGGLILDPFTGSGTTGCAAVAEGFRFVGAEREAEYVEIARARIAHWAAQAQPDLLTAVNQ